MNPSPPAEVRLVQASRTDAAAARLAVHMIRTYEWLRIGITLVTVWFLVTLLLARNMSSETHPEARNSISAYYHQNNDGWRMRDIFVASLFAVGVMLITYRGFTPGESMALSVAGAALIGVAWFPMDPPDNKPAARGSPTEIAHYLCAVTFFVGLAYVCLRETGTTLDHTCFGKSDRRTTFERVYKVIGVSMLLFPLLSFCMYFAGAESFVFWAEVSGVLVFLAYWVTKTVELRRPLLPAEGTGATAPTGTESNEPAADMTHPLLDPPPPRSTNAEWVTAFCAVGTALAGVFGVYSYYDATQRERVRASQEAIARIYPMDSDIKRLQGQFDDLRVLMRHDPEGEEWDARKNKPGVREAFNSLCSGYGNLFEYYSLIRETMLNHPQGKAIVSGWDAYFKEICQQSYAFRGYILKYRQVWSGGKAEEKSGKTGSKRPPNMRDETFMMLFDKFRDGKDGATDVQEPTRK